MKKLLFIVFFCMTTAFGADDFYHFSSAGQKLQFEQLTTGLRCLVCQNQTIAESNASLAGDLRTQVYEQVQNGKSNEEIIHFLVARYGDYILYQPPLKTNTYVLWFLPFVLLISAVGYLLYYIRREQKTC